MKEERNGGQRELRKGAMRERETGVGGMIILLGHVMAGVLFWGESKQR